MRATMMSGRRASITRVASSTLRVGCDGKVQPREDRFAARVAVLVVVDDEDERGEPLPVALATAAPSRRTPIGTASLVVFVVHSPECNDVTHAGDFEREPGPFLPRTTRASSGGDLFLAKSDGWIETQDAEGRHHAGDAGHGQQQNHDPA